MGLLSQGLEVGFRKKDALHPLANGHLLVLKYLYAVTFCHYCLFRTYASIILDICGLAEKLISS